MRLILFFTGDTPLLAWEQAGMLAREVALYQRLQACGVDVSFITYGGPSDLAYADRIPGIRILCNRWDMPPERYKRWLHLLHGWHLLRCDVIKTNQTHGADIALRAARFWRKPLVARCGYMFSVNAAHLHGANSEMARRARYLEETVFPAARCVVVTAPMMAEDIAQRIPQAASQTRVIPNYVETDRFCPTDRPREVDLIFVGRLTEHKNLAALLEAVRPLGASLMMVGIGPFEDELKAQAQGMDVRWMGLVPNDDLPDYLNRAKIFVLPSLYEGHPKTLIEAMACGLPVLGADSPGIRGVIEHEQNGLLCGTDADCIREALQRLLDDAALRARLGQAARQYAEAHYALDRIIDMELLVYKDAMS